MVVLKTEKQTFLGDFGAYFELSPLQYHSYLRNIGTIGFVLKSCPRNILKSSATLFSKRTFLTSADRMVLPLAYIYKVRCKQIRQVMSD